MGLGLQRGLHWGLRWGFGLAALAAFLIMTLVVAPEVPGDLLRPQDAWPVFSDADLLALRSHLEASQLGPRYRAMLLVVDSIFLLLFAAWAWVCLWGRAPRSLALVLPLWAAVADLCENGALVARLGLAGTGSFDPSLMVSDPSGQWVLAVVKMAGYLACLGAILWVALKERLR